MARSLWLSFRSVLTAVESPHLYVAMNHVVVMAIPERLQNLPHVVTAQTQSRVSGRGGGGYGIWRQPPSGGSTWPRLRCRRTRHRLVSRSRSTGLRRPCWGRHGRVTQQLGAAALPVCVWDLQLEDHVEHAVGAVGLQQLHDVGVFQHVADAGLPLQIWVKETKRNSVCETEPGLIVLLLLQQQMEIAEVIIPLPVAELS